MSVMNAAMGPELELHGLVREFISTAHSSLVRPQLLVPDFCRCREDRQVGFSMRRQHRNKNLARNGVVVDGRAFDALRQLRRLLRQLLGKRERGRLSNDDFALRERPHRELCRWAHP